MEVCSLLCIFVGALSTRMVLVNCQAKEEEYDFDG